VTTGAQTSPSDFPDPSSQHQRKGRRVKVKTDAAEFYGKVALSPSITEKG
jgi:hypothetical protein